MTKRPCVGTDTKCVKRPNVCEGITALNHLSQPQLANPPKHSIPSELRARVEKLSFHSLRVELSRRRQPTSGLRDELRQRLLAHIATQSPQFISVPLTFPTFVIPPHPDILRSPGSSVPPRPNVLGCPGTTRPPSLQGLQGSQLQLQPVPEAPTSAERKVAVVIENPDALARNAIPRDDHNVTVEHFSGDRPLTTPQIENGSSDLDPNVYRPVVGVLRVRTVWICGERNMRAFWRHAGPLGKASLSRSSPCYYLHDERSWRGRAARQLLELEGKSNDASGDCQARSIEPPPADSDRADLEHLQLTLVEAYYAAFVKQVLLLQDEAGNFLQDAPSTWRLFCARAGQKFPATFVVYCRYRAAGWIPRSGLKYGTDWVLYPASSKRHTHSPFCVVLRFRGNEPKRLDRTWVSLQNRIRLVKNVSKTLIIAEVITAPNFDTISDVREAFKAISVSEITVDRWVP